jgi:hypothetical protein
MLDRELDKLVMITYESQLSELETDKLVKYARLVASLIKALPDKPEESPEIPQEVLERLAKPEPDTQG